MQRMHNPVNGESGRTGNNANFPVALQVLIPNQALPGRSPGALSTLVVPTYWERVFTPQDPKLGGSRPQAGLLKLGGRGHAPDDTSAKTRSQS